MKEAFIIIDIGSGNTRVAVVDTSGNILSIAKENTVFYTDHEVYCGQYFLPEEWRGNIFRLIRQAVAQAGEIRILAICPITIRQGIVLIGKEGKALIGYSNADRRGQPYMQDFDWDRITQLTGLSPSGIYSAIKVVGVKHLDPELLAKTRYYTSISDWIGYLLTGICVWEKAQAMQSCLYDAVTEDWSEEICHMMGLDRDQLPKLADCGTILGMVKSDICRELGLQEPIPCVIGTADTQAALAAACPEPGDVVIVSGTTSPCLKITTRFHPYPKSWVSPTIDPGRYMLEVNTASCGINVQRFRNVMMPDVSYEELAEDALQRGMPEQNLPEVLAVFSPGLHLDRVTPDGGFVMRSPISLSMHRNDFFHAMALNTAMSVTLCLQRMKELDGLDKPYLIGSGGGFASPVTSQAIADLMGMPVKIYENYRESAVCGGFILCCRAMGRQIPRWKEWKILQPRHSDALQEYFSQWKEARMVFQQMTFQG